MGADHPRFVTSATCDDDHDDHDIDGDDDNGEVDDDDPPASKVPSATRLEVSKIYSKIQD